MKYKQSLIKPRINSSKKSSLRDAQDKWSLGSNNQTNHKHKWRKSKKEKIHIKRIRKRKGNIVIDTEEIKNIMN